MTDIYVPTKKIEMVKSLALEQTESDFHTAHFDMRTAWVRKKFDDKGNLIFESEPQHNSFTTQGDILVASVFLGYNPSGTQWKGHGYWALGYGKPSWDALPAPPPVDPNAAVLVHELPDSPVGFNRQETECYFLTEQNIPTAAPTRKLEIKARFGVLQGNGDRREWGIFGGNASSTRNTGYLFDAVHHVKDTKTADPKQYEVLYVHVEFKLPKGQ